MEKEKLIEDCIKVVCAVYCAESDVMKAFGEKHVKVEELSIGEVIRSIAERLASMVENKDFGENLDGLGR